MNILKNDITDTLRKQNMDSTLTLIIILLLGYALLNPFEHVNEKCYDGITYITTLNGIAPKMDSSSKVITCTGNSK